MIAIFESVLQCYQASSVGYGLIIQEIVKVAVALVLILGFKQIISWRNIRFSCFLLRSSILLYLSFVGLL